MYTLIAFVIGAALGWYRATKRNGNTLDKLQYAFGFGIAVMIVVMFALILLRNAGII